jgi:pimeloyl-ACP methyl ester carboxylesterase
MLHPYLPGHIPLVLVHGTFSSPATWAEMINELENDFEIAKHYQPWLFIYNSGNPIAYSGGLLVEALKRIRQEIDPNQLDPALDRMVVVGHSQGGLVTKLTAVSSGDRFWKIIAPVPFDQVTLEPDNRELLQRTMFYEPLPFVKRVIFMSTPHHGSYLAAYAISSWVSRLVKMPLSLTQLTMDLATQNSDAPYVSKLRRMPTSLDNMSPRNPFLQVLS